TSKHRLSGPARICSCAGSYTSNMKHTSHTSRITSNLTQHTDLQGLPYRSVLYSTCY
ncbi:hypothetical protein L9F63_019981, partial [Diploptera punctata]